MNLSLRSRIAFHYVVAAGAIILVVFLLLYWVMYRTVYNHLDHDLFSEAQSVIHAITILNDGIAFADEREWEEKEHRQAEVNPMFLQVIDPRGAVIRKSPNLGAERLIFEASRPGRIYVNTTIGTSAVRQLQVPLQNSQGKVLGHLLVAMPRQEAEVVLVNLRVVLILAFPIVLAVVYFSSRWIAKSSVSPVERITAIAERITSQNLNERVEPPAYKDELFRLTTTINQLLDRLQNAVLRERQFTADASHELRNPLAALKGTLEVLVRKRRTPEHYEEKIRYCMTETDRLSDLVEQLLMLARCEASQIVPALQPCNLRETAGTALRRLEPLMNSRNSKAAIPAEDGVTALADPNMLEVMIQNILSNAVKYSPQGSTVEIGWSRNDQDVSLRIRDHGIGIAEEAKPHIFERFFRADDSRVDRAGGAGLGLAIVKRLAELQKLELAIHQEQDGGTTFEILLPASAENSSSRALQN